jgi:hypothetical protein
MCVKPMEENEDDKVVNMIINYFSARVNIVERREQPQSSSLLIWVSFYYPNRLERPERAFGQEEETQGVVHLIHARF